MQPDKDNKVNALFQQIRTVSQNEIKTGKKCK